MKVLEGVREVAQLWMIGKFEYTTLVVNQYLSYTVKLCLTIDNCVIPRMILKKLGNLGKDQDLFSIEMIINISTKPDNVQDLIDLISDDKEVYKIVQIILIQDTFLFTYDVYEEVGVDGNYPNPGYDIDNFKTRAKVVVKFQVNSRNFKASKKIDIVKIYLFPFLVVYLVDDPNNKTISTSKNSTRETTSG